MVYYSCNNKLCISSSLSLSLLFFSCLCAFVWILIWEGERERKGGKKRKEGSEKRREKCDKTLPSSCPPRLYCKMKKGGHGRGEILPRGSIILVNLYFFFLTFTMKNCNTRPRCLRGKSCEKNKS